VQRQLASALEEELDVEELGTRTPMAEVPPKPARRSASSSSGGKKEKDKYSFWAQFQTGERSLSSQITTVANPVLFRQRLVRTRRRTSAEAHS
jgi:hypothetical protein